MSNFYYKDSYEFLSFEVFYVLLFVLKIWWDY